MSKKFFLILFLVVQLNATAQVLPQLPVADSVKILLTNTAVQFECEEGVSYLYNFKFDKASVQFQFIRQKYKNHPLPYFLMGLNEWWKIVPNIDNQKYDEKFLAYMDTAIEKAEELFDANEKNIEAAFFLAGAHSFKGRLHAERHNWTKATIEGKRALKYMEVASEQNDLSPEFLFGDGLYNYFAIWIPKNYPVLKPVLWFFKKGDKEKGIQQLETVVKEGFYTRVEAQYFLMRIYGNDENQPEKAFQICSYLHKTYPDNAYFHRYYARMLFTSGRLYELEPAAESILRKIDTGMAGYEEISGRYASFFLGYLHRVWKKDAQQAKHYYERTVQFSEKIKDYEAGYYLYALLYLGQIAQAEKDYGKAKSYFDKVVDKAPRKHDAKKDAEKALNEIKKINKANKKKK